MGCGKVFDVWEEAHGDAASFPKVMGSSRDSRINKVSKYEMLGCADFFFLKM